MDQASALSPGLSRSQIANPRGQDKFRNVRELSCEQSKMIAPCEIDAACLADVPSKRAIFDQLAECEFEKDIALPVHGTSAGAHLREDLGGAIA